MSHFLAWHNNILSLQKHSFVVRKMQKSSIVREPFGTSTNNVGGKTKPGTQDYSSMQVEGP